MKILQIADNADVDDGQLVEHWAVTQEVVSSTPAGPALRVLRCCLCNYINKRLDFQVFSDKDYKPEVVSKK